MIGIPMHILRKVVLLKRCHEPFVCKKLLLALLVFGIISCENWFFQLVPLLKE